MSQITLAGTPVVDKDVKIQIYDSATGTWIGGGAADHTYYWWNADGSYPAGWFDGNGNDVGDADIPAGGAFYVSSKKSGVILQFPKVLK